MPAKANSSSPNSNKSNQENISEIPAIDVSHQTAGKTCGQIAERQRVNRGLHAVIRSKIKENKKLFSKRARREE